MTYKEYVLEVFVEDQAAYGTCTEELNDIIEETPFKQIEKFLKKSGYDLQNDYNWAVGE